MKKRCLICGKEFETIKGGNKRLYCFECSPQTKNSGTAITYIRQAIKRQLVLYKGGKCECCGYDKCINALQLHHRNPEEKEFEISDYTYFTLRPMEEYYKEADKCDLLCSNCHIEKHSK